MELTPILSEEERLEMNQLHNDLTEARRILREIEDLITEPLSKLTRILNAESVKTYLDSKLGDNTRSLPVFEPPKVLDESGDDSKFFDFTDV